MTNIRALENKFNMAISHFFNRFGNHAWTFHVGQHTLQKSPRDTDNVYNSTTLSSMAAHDIGHFSFEVTRSDVGQCRHLLATFVVLATVGRATLPRLTLALSGWALAVAAARRYYNKQLQLTFY